MVDFTVRDLTDQPMENLHRAMIAAFSDYVVPLRPSAETFSFMMLQRGLRADVSVGAFVGDELAALWLVGVEGQASYLITSGTSPAFRGRGLAMAMAQASFDRLWAAGQRQFETEVIAGNLAAERLYEKLGMTEQRRLSCYELSTDTTPRSPECFALEQVQWAQIRAQAKLCRDWAPSWQQSDRALDRLGRDVYAIALQDDRGLAGYAVVLRPNGVIAQIAVRPDQRRRGLGRALINAAGKAGPAGGLRIVNADAADLGFAGFMNAVDAKFSFEQIALRGKVPQPRGLSCA